MTGALIAVIVALYLCGLAPAASMFALMKDDDGWARRNPGKVRFMVIMWPLTGAVNVMLLIEKMLEDRRAA